MLFEEVARHLRVDAPVIGCIVWPAMSDDYPEKTGDN
jgi:hypothetical protein